ncbi:protein-glutamate methyltransferase [Acetobacteraceae bacterium KSS8]|uniref:protein-glutamate O-methyltransferase n=1 Tax=Endosaccharibacter trunci TaxID=2812733 RepID=A0ABT1W773_9PROT|nr:protein-glutamate methyltransferase [Acetobacteraceae bacterium KSS8]
MSSIDASVFGRIKRLVIERTLHHYYDNKDDQLHDRLRRRLAATGLDPESYLHRLESGDAAEWGRLESEITINETFFFRFAEQFGALRDTILPSLVQARSATRRLRIWSAGCSTGAEPYSVAILLHRLLGPALRDWSVSILGTDIDEAAVATARAGEFTDWALRTLSAEERRRDFIPSGEERSRRWTLRPAFRGMVRFEKRNLLDALNGSLAVGEEYDLILCRNVLIYFHQDTVRALLRRFGAALAEDGWLLLGHAEAVGHAPDALQPVMLDGTVVWRRADLVGAAAPPISSPSTSSPRISSVPIAASPPSGTSGPARPRTAQRPAAHSLRTTPSPPPPSPVAGPAAAEGDEPDAASAIDVVRDLADRGLPDEALRACDLALGHHPLCAELFFYAALLNRALSRDGDAEAAFRRALYLRKDFVMAHYHLGLLLLDTGRPVPGRRRIGEARRIALDLPEAAALPCGDGMTAGRLLALSRQNWFAQADGVPGESARAAR